MLGRIYKFWYLFMSLSHFSLSSYSRTALQTASVHSISLQKWFHVISSHFLILCLLVGNECEMKVYIRIFHPIVSSLLLLSMSCLSFPQPSLFGPSTMFLAFPQISFLLVSVTLSFCGVWIFLHSLHWVFT